VVKTVILSLFGNGHSLLVGVPGLAKTLLVSTIAEVLDLDFKRIQFTPDLMPSDITGAEILDESRQFKFNKGPLFSNIVLADEINRTPPKTQAALLEAMQERSVTVSGVRHVLDKPFFVLATQNPIEQEGTYPLPEAQLDRFMFNIPLDYPSYAEEVAVVKGTTTNQKPQLNSILSGEQIMYFQNLIRKIPISDNVLEYLMSRMHTLSVADVRRETDDTVSVAIDVPADLQDDFKFISGQYLTLEADIAGEPVRRSYSLCSAPSDGEWRVAIKKVHEGKFSTYANEVLATTDKLRVMSPAGNFKLSTNSDHEKHYVAFGAGSGITPIFSMIKSVLREEPQSRFTLFYGNKTAIRR